MTPFLQFRVWIRRGPTGQRIAASAAALLAVALLVWAAIPLAATDQEVATGFSDAAEQPTLGTSPTRGTTPDGASSTESGVAPTTNPSASTATASTPAGDGDDGRSSPTSAATPQDPGAPVPGEQGPCAMVAATDQGVSEDEVFVAVPHIALAGGAANAAFGIRSPSQIRKVIAALTDAINDAGGVACRTLRTKAYPVNTIDQNDQRAKCLQIVDDKPFAVVDLGGYITEASRRCFVDAGIPWIGATAANASEEQAAYPYLMTLSASGERQLRNWVFEAPTRGWFTGPDFDRLGIFLDECNTSANQALLAELANQGVTDDKISVFTMSGCGSIGPPAEVSGAVAQHRRDNVSHVFLAGNGANSQNYVRNADGLNWKPRYLTSDYGSQTLPTLAPQWPAGFDGAIAITSTRSGERNSGITAPWVATCNQWLTERGVRPSEEEADQNPMNTCDQLRLFVAAADTLGTDLTRPQLAEALARVGLLETAVAGDAVYDRRGKVSGGDFIRAIQYHSSCRCWKVIDPQTKPGH